MTQDVQWIRKALIQRKEYDALQKEIETLRIELLAADYEAEPLPAGSRRKRNRL